MYCKFEIQKKPKAQIHKFVLQNFIDYTFGDDEWRSEKFACYCLNLQSTLKEWLLNPKNKKIARNLFTEQQAKRSILPEVWQAIDHHY